jgi:hypothetical protein
MHRLFIFIPSFVTADNGLWPMAARGGRQLRATDGTVQTPLTEGVRVRSGAAAGRHAPRGGKAGK